MQNAPPTAPAFAILPPRYATCTVRPPRMLPSFVLTAALVSLSGAVAGRDSLGTVRPGARS